MMASETNARILNAPYLSKEPFVTVAPHTVHFGKHSSKEHSKITAMWRCYDEGLLTEVRRVSVLKGKISDGH